MPEYSLMEQTVLVALWVGLIYGLYGLVLGYLALTDLEWRQLIKDRLREEWRGLKLRFILACLSLAILVERGYWLLRRILSRRRGQVRITIRVDDMFTISILEAKEVLMKPLDRPASRFAPGPWE